VEGLGHGAKLLAQANGLGRSDTQCHLRLISIHAQQARAPCGGSQYTRGARDMPAFA